MGKASNTVKDRVCLCCKKTVETDSKGLRKHFKECCREARGLAPVVEATE